MNFSYKFIFWFNNKKVFKYTKKVNEMALGKTLTVNNLTKK